MAELWIPAAFYRGGSSKGVFFHHHDLPADAAVRDRIFLSVIGSPDPYGRQLDGMGGGISSLSKVVMIGPPTREDTDVDYTFGRWRSIVPSSIGGQLWQPLLGGRPFAIDEGLVPGPDGERLVRIHQTNTRKVIHARFQVRDGKAVTAGDFAIAGVAGTGARIRLDFLDPGGSVTAGLLPTGNPMDRLALPGRPPVTVSLVDATNPVVFVAAADIGLTGTELPDAIEARPEVMALLDRLRRHAGVLAGLGGTPGAVPWPIPRLRSWPRRRRSAPWTSAGSDQATTMSGCGCCRWSVPTAPSP